MLSSFHVCLILMGCLSVQVEGSTLCQAQERCGDCQTAGPECSWCSDVTFSGLRCDNTSNLIEAGCQDIVFVDSAVQILQNEPISDTISMAPQRVKLNIVKNKGREATFLVRVKSRASGRRSRKMTIRAQHPSNLVVVINSPCPQNAGFWLSRAPWRKNTLTCPSVQPGEVVEFEVKVWIRECKSFRERMRLKVSGMSGSVRVDVTSQCSCPCEASSLMASTEPDEYCRGNGELRCGQCECYPGYNGHYCQCDKGEYASLCGTGRGEVCNGRGECVCGHCKCGRKETWENPYAAYYSGALCECDDYGCRTFHGEMCGGPSRGRCLCGRCLCQPGYVGEACEVDQRNASCLGSYGLICNERGACVDGRCECEGVWSGPTCETCQVCAARCPSLVGCVQCRVFQSGPLTPEQCNAQCSNYTLYEVNDIHETKIARKTICREHTAEGILTFIHYENWENRTVLVANNEMEAI